MTRVFFTLKTTSICVLSVCLLAVTATGIMADDGPFRALSVHEQRSEDLLRELIAYETTAAKAIENRRAMEAMKAHLLAAGFEEADVQIITPQEGVHGLVARYRGQGNGRPIGAIAHMDVVPANPDAWAFPPFTLGVKDGFYLGRGTNDNKAGVVQIIGNFIRLKEEGWVPSRDLIASITGDEETMGLMATWFAGEGRHLVDAEFILNSDGGSGELDDDGNPVAQWIQTSEKLYQTWELSTENVGGHSSVPRADNAIYDLARAITRLEENPLPIEISDSMKLGLQRSAHLFDDETARDMLLVANEGDLAAAQRLISNDPQFNAQLRTTCVPTLLRGGQVENALPRDAVVTVNCRILPGTDPADVESHIMGLMGGLNVKMTSLYDAMASPPSDMPPAFLETMESLVQAHYGDVPVIPSMSTGATDAVFYRNAGIPVYGTAILFEKSGESRAHGLDEKVRIDEFHRSVAFWYDMLKKLAE